MLWEITISLWPPQILQVPESTSFCCLICNMDYKSFTENNMFSLVNFFHNESQSWLCFRIWRIIGKCEYRLRWRFFLLLLFLLFVFMEWIFSIFSTSVKFIVLLKPQVWGWIKFKSIRKSTFSWATRSPWLFQEAANLNNIWVSSFIYKGSASLSFL